MPEVAEYCCRSPGPLALCIVLLSLSSIARPEASECRETGLSADQRAAAAAADRAYADAWLSNEPDEVMATLTPDPVIVPSGMKPIAGREAIRAFWFAPDSPPTIVKRFDLAQEEVAGAAGLAYARGSFQLAFDYDGKSYESEGTYFTFLRREDDGSWRIARRMWNDHQRTVLE